MYLHDYYVSFQQSNVGAARDPRQRELEACLGLCRPRRHSVCGSKRAEILGPRSYRGWQQGR